MVTIFAARDISGETRYIGEVARGAACNCFCLVCGSPLVAAQGEINDWYFAHERNQERPECPAGALNLLRRIAVEELACAAWRIAPMAVPHPAAGNPPITWNDRPAGPVQVAEGLPSGPTVPAGTVPLVTSGSASIYVVVGRERGPAAEPTASLRLVVPLPEGVVIRSEEDARQFVRNTMRLEWIYLPDTLGLVDAARRAFEERERLAREEWARQLRASSLQAGRRWAAIRRGMSDVNSGDFPTPSPAPTVAASPAAPSASSAFRPEVAWAPGLAGRGSIQYRRMDDETEWVFYPAGEHGWRIAPVPVAFDGWDEFFPPSIAVVDGPGWLRVVNESRLLMWFNSRARRSVIDSDPQVIESHFRG